MGINYPDALEGIRKDYIVKLGHAPKDLNSGKKNLDLRDDDPSDMCNFCQDQKNYKSKINYTINNIK